MWRYVLLTAAKGYTRVRFQVRNSATQKCYSSDVNYLNTVRGTEIPTAAWYAVCVEALLAITPRPNKKAATITLFEARQHLSEAVIVGSIWEMIIYLWQRQQRDIALLARLFEGGSRSTHQKSDCVITALIETELRDCSIGDWATLESAIEYVLAC